MNFRSLLMFAATACSLTLAAEESLVSNVTIRQRWPWSDRVDIDYDYSGSTETTLVFTATWRGQESPVNLAQLNETGAFLVKPGHHRLSWDPAAAGYDGTTLLDFQVTVGPGKDPRTYLILDLLNGGYTFLDDVPADGWTDLHRTDLMVFRRIPAGTYQLGTAEADILSVIGEVDNYNSSPERSYATSSDPRTVTLTSDFYFAIFLMTGHQYNLIRGKPGGNYRTPLYTTPASQGGGAAIRGAFLDDGTTAVDWPSTGYQVNSTSLVGRARALSAKTGQPVLRIDLVTDAQWEVAMRAGTTTFYPNGGTTANTSDELKTLYSAIVNAKYDTGKDTWTHLVGLKDPNRWGLYDYAVRGELVLDYANYSGLWGTGAQHNLSGLAGGIDPVGPQTATSTHKYRVKRSGEANFTSWGQTSFARTFTALRRTTQIHLTGDYNSCLRLAIHLKPLVDVE